MGGLGIWGLEFTHVAFRVSGIRGLGWGLGFRGFGVWGLGNWGLGFWFVKHAWLTIAGLWLGM